MTCEDILEDLNKKKTIDIEKFKNITYFKRENT